MSDEEHTEDNDEEVEEDAMNESVEEEAAVMDNKADQEDEGDPSTTEKTLVVEDVTRPLPASIYLNPPERRWVLPSFLGMLVVYFTYYWFTYLGTL